MIAVILPGKQRPLQHAARLSLIICVPFLGLSTSQTDGRAQAMGMVLKQEARAQGLSRQPSCTVRAARPAPGAQQLCSNVQRQIVCRRVCRADVDLYDSVVAAPKSSFVMRQTA